MLPIAALALAWTPSAPVAWAGAARYGPLFDPLVEFAYEPPSRVASPRPLLLYLPGLDGNPLTGFAQFPGLAKEYDVLGFAPDRTSDRSASDHAGLVAAVAGHLRELAAAGRDVFLIGESFGGVQALATAMALSNERSDDEPLPLRGLVLVNPATSYPRTDLPELAERLPAMPDRQFNLQTAWLTASRVIDGGQLRTILSTVIDNPLNDPTRVPADLAAYYTAAIGAFTECAAAPRPYFLGRLSSIGPAAEEVNAALDAERAAGIGELPVLLVCGTADRMALSLTEGPRLRKLVGSDLAEVHFVDGAGHAGTLDERCDLCAVMGAWRKRAADR